ncbi:MAG: hypothetical protein OXT71_17825 [Acidobacteriota bacterium]|nr:hypothetical protein [Acidobacteriota bacterium]
MNSGIQVNMVTKSGTNEIHGNVFWDHRNSAVNARNFFDPSRESRVREGLSEVPILQFNIFGASIGGPIVQDKTFFFFNYQGTRENKSLTRPASVPTMKMRNGDFSEILPGTVIRDPLTGDPIPGNIIPENRIHPVARNMMFGVGEVMPLWPVPDRPGLANNILPSRAQEQVFDQFVFRVDPSVTDSDNAYVRYIYDKQDRVLRYNKFLHQLPDYNDIFATPAHNARVGWTKVMGASAVNELKLGVNRMTQTLEDEICGTPVPKLLGIEGTSTLFQYNPWVAASGFSRTGTLLNAPNNRVDNTYLAGDAISWNVGSHALGFGGEWREREQNGGSQPIPNGYFIFGPFYTGYSMADLMLGYHRTAITGREAAAGARPEQLGPQGRAGHSSLRRERDSHYRATVGWRQPTANSSYHGMRVNLEQGFSNGFLGNISYVYSKWLDCGGNNLFADLGDSVKRNPFDCSAEWGRSSSDYRQRFVYNFVYQIPIMRGSGHGLAGAILGDWNISSIGTFSSSGAVDVASPFDPDNSGGANRPDLTGDPNSGAAGNAQQWFNTRAFTRVPNPADTGVYRFGNAGRNVIDGPGWTTVDFSIWKSWHVAQERARVEFRVDFFNITNHTNFDLPSTLFTGGAFATMGNAGNSRHLQFGLDIDFLQPVDAPEERTVAKSALTGSESKEKLKLCFLKLKTCFPGALGRSC